MLHQNVRDILRADFERLVSCAKCVFCGDMFKVKGWRKRGYRLNGGRHGQACDRCRQLYKRYTSRLT